MPWHSFEGYKELRKKASFAIAGGEAEYDYRGFVEAIREHVVDVIQPDLAASGGLTNPVAWPSWPRPSRSISSPTSLGRSWRCPRLCS